MIHNGRVAQLFLARALLLCSPVAAFAGREAPRTIIVDSQGTSGPAVPSFPQQRIPRQVAPKTAALEGIIRGPDGRGAGGISLTLRNLSSGESRETSTNAEGVFRWLGLPPGRYALSLAGEGYEPFTVAELRLDPGDVISLELALEAVPAAPAPISRVPRLPEMGPPAPEITARPLLPYRELRRRADAEPGAEELQPEVLPPVEQVFLAMPDRWDIPMPEWDRYGKPIDAGLFSISLRRATHFSTAGACRCRATSARRARGARNFLAEASKFCCSRHSGSPSTSFTAIPRSAPWIGAFG